jgi:hypothetical protein
MCCNNEDDYWDCPTCLQPMPPEVDRVCDCCDRRVSHHISVESMCRVIREWKRRADEAEAQNAKLKQELHRLTNIIDRALMAIEDMQ